MEDEHYNEHHKAIKQYQESITKYNTRRDVPRRTAADRENPRGQLARPRCCCCRAHY